MPAEGSCHQSLLHMQGQQGREAYWPLGDTRMVMGPKRGL